MDELTRPRILRAPNAGVIAAPTPEKGAGASMVAEVSRGESLDRFVPDSPYTFEQLQAMTRSASIGSKGQEQFSWTLFALRVGVLAVVALFLFRVMTKLTSMPILNELFAP